MSFLIVFLGAGCGGALRHGLNLLLLRPGGFSPATLVINILGSTLIGVLSETWALRSGLPAEGRLFLVTGLLGGFTTFSSFTLEAGLLVERGQIGTALLYIVSSVGLSLAGFFLGLRGVRWWLG